MLTRYAPSPTGHLHLGHVVNAIYVWGLARAVDGRVLLRMKDHDRIRCRPGYESRDQCDARPSECITRRAPAGHGYWYCRNIRTS